MRVLLFGLAALALLRRPRKAGGQSEVGRPPTSIEPSSWKEAAQRPEEQPPSRALAELERLREEYRRVRRRMEETERRIREKGPIEYLVRF